MRLLILFAAAFFAAAPVNMTASEAYADGIERPRQRQRPRPQPAPEPELLGPREEVRVVEDSRYVTLPASFFVGGGGVGVDIGGGAYSSTTVIVRGGSARASAFAAAFARARASAGGGGGHGGCCR